MKFKIIFILLLLPACKPDTIIKREFIDVPVVTIKSCQKPAQIDEIRNLPLYSIDDNSTDEQIARAYVESMVILKTKYNQMQEAQKPFGED